jgi:hypothetical protein
VVWETLGCNFCGDVLEITGLYQKTSVALERAGEEKLKQSGLKLRWMHCTSSEGSLR